MIIAALIKPTPPLKRKALNMSGDLDESRLVSDILRALWPVCWLTRVNVGTVKTAEGFKFSTGVPRGYSDLSGHRRSDGRAVYIECKTPVGRVSEHQEEFLSKMRETGAIAGVCRSVEDAFRLIHENTFS